MLKAGHLIVLAGALIGGLIVLLALGTGHDGEPTPHDSIIRQTVTALEEATIAARGLEDFP